MATEYISRETVLKYVEDWSCGYDYIETETNGAINDIKAITAADVRPVVRGKWIDGKCDQCGEHAPYWCMASTYYTSPFCPNCGADMREG